MKDHVGVAFEVQWSLGQSRGSPLTKIGAVTFSRDAWSLRIDRHAHVGAGTQQPMRAGLCLAIYNLSMQPNESPPGNDLRIDGSNLTSKGPALIAGWIDPVNADRKSKALLRPNLIGAQ